MCAGGGRPLHDGLPAEPDGATTHTDYDALGRQIAVTDQMNRVTYTAYDFRGDLTDTWRYFGADDQVHTHGDYDADGNLVSAQDAESGTVTYTYDALDRMTTQKESVSATKDITTSFGYDAAGNRTRVTDGRGNSTISTYTTWGLLESTVEPATAAYPSAADRTWTLGYDAAGQNTTETEPGGITRTRTYDLLHDLTSETGTGAEAATTPRTLRYDLSGRLISSGQNGLQPENTYAYNDRGELLSSAGSSGSSVYSYDSDGRMASRQDAAGTSTFDYDTNGRLRTTTDAVTGGRMTASYYDDDQVHTQQFSTASGTPTATRTYGYDDLGRLTGDTLTDPVGTTTASTAYGYDRNGRLASKTTTGTAGAAHNTYAYDWAGRLTSWNDGTTATAYGWDDSGNRTSVGSRTATYDERDEQLTDGTTTSTYSARGDLASRTTAGTTRSYTFDAFDRMTGDGATTYAYDSTDRLVLRGTTAFTYDGGSNSVVTDGTYTYSHGADGAVLGATNGTTAQWELTDAHTDVVAGLSPSAAALTGSTAYDPFGTVTATTGTLASVGFQSGWTDPDTGNVDMAARWYQPGSGTFTARDSAALEPTPSIRTNRYLYGEADPLDGTDPTGHKWGPWDVVKVAVRENPLADAAEVFWDVYMAGSDSIGNDDCLNGYICRYTTVHENFCDTHSWAAQCGGSGTFPYSAGGGEFVPGRGHGGHGGGGGGNGGGGGGGTPTAPPRPPIDQNPYNGPHPLPAPTLPVAVAVATNAIWTTADGVAATITAEEAAALLDPTIFDPEPVPIEEPYWIPIPKDNPGGKKDVRRRQDDKCDTGPGLSATGHAVYLPRERYYDAFERQEECRATGVYGLLDRSDYVKDRKKTPGVNTGTRKPPGMQEIRSQGEKSGNGHLLPAAAHGSGLDLRNLVAQYKRTNEWYLNHGIEKGIREAIKANKHVLISIVPHYGNVGSGIPTSIEYNYSVLEDSSSLHCVIYQHPSGGTTTGSPDCPTK